MAARMQMYCSYEENGKEERSMEISFRTYLACVKSSCKVHTRPSQRSENFKLCIVFNVPRSGAVPISGNGTLRLRVLMHVVGICFHASHTIVQSNPRKWHI